MTRTLRLDFGRGAWVRPGPRTLTAVELEDVQRLVDDACRRAGVTRVPVELGDPNAPPSVRATYVVGGWLPWEGETRIVVHPCDWPGDAVKLARALEEIVLHEVQHHVDVTYGVDCANPHGTHDDAFYARVACLAAAVLL